MLEENGDYFGDAVNTAARMAEFAKAGQIITTGATVAALSRKLCIETVVRRDQVLLRGHGTLSFGHSASDPGAELVTFVCEIRTNPDDVKSAGK